MSISSAPLRRAFLLGLSLTLLALLAVTVPTQSTPHSAQAQEAHITYLPLINVNYQTGPAIIQGYIFDALIGKEGGPLAGAQVCIQNTTICDTSETDGSYSLDGFNNGLQTVVASKEGYSTLVRQVTAKYFNGSPETITTLDLPLSPSGLGSDQYRIVLSWDPARPVDLDANLWLPRDNPYHVNQVEGTNAGRGNCSTFPDACIDVDSVDGSAPETITISDAHAGTYVYAVRHYDFASGNYENKPPLDETGAHVDVYDNSGLIASFAIPSSSDDRAIWWHVFDLDGATGTLTPVNEVNSADPTGGGYPSE